MATMYAAVNGWRARVSKVWYPTDGSWKADGSSTGINASISDPSGNNKYGVIIKVTTPNDAKIGSISNLSVSFEVYSRGTTTGALYGSLRTTYTDSGTSDTSSTFRTNAIGNEASITGITTSSTSPSWVTMSFSGSFSKNTSYYLFLYTKSTSHIFGMNNSWNGSATATYSVKTYSVTYNANGGTGAPGSQTKTHDVTLTLSSTKPTKANTSAGTYTVTLNANGGSCSSASLAAARTTKYSFSKWNTNSSDSGTSYNAGASYTANAALSLYAIYTSTTTTASVTLPTPTREGYQFLGWGTSSTATSGITGSYTPTSNVTLYALWAAQGLIYIGNAAYQVYIGNGSSWDLYAPYVGNGSGWDLCS